eukprot:3865823-Rhodomonas_salina.1
MLSTAMVFESSARSLAASDSPASTTFLRLSTTDPVGVKGVFPAAGGRESKVREREEEEWGVRQQRGRGRRSERWEAVSGKALLDVALRRR